jgi:hypothetical protein
MRKLIPKHRPSAGVIIGFLALAVALGGGAIAAKKKTKKVPYKGLDKEARLKVLPISATNAGNNADPNAAGTFTDLTQVSTNVSTAFPRRVALNFDGIFNAAEVTPPVTPIPNARGECRLEADNQPIQGTTIKIDTPPHPPVAPDTATDYGQGAGINIVTTPLGGKHTFSVACNETAGNLKVEQFQLSALTVR